MSHPPILNAAFYMFTDMTPLAALRTPLLERAVAAELKGSIILSYEGINGMLAGEEERLVAFLDELMELRPALRQMPIKKSYSEQLPFHKLVVKIKPEIVTMRVDHVDARARTAEHLPPERFRDWLRQEREIVLIDVRNDFECQLGTFKGAINPQTSAFHQFPDYVRAHGEQWRDKEVVMFCTGGIRCEKATSWMLEQGFEKVYQLEGGILNYFEAIPDAEEDWRGELFVFDERVTLDTSLHPTGTTIEELKERFPAQDASEQA